MPNYIFNKILNRKLDTFYNVFSSDSESIFNTEGKLYHPQEFGIYRERVLSDLIKTVIPQNFKISDGFIITPKNNLSTQTDIIIFNENNTPVINDGVLRFFPIESVHAVGEVKSIIRSKKELKEILIKLSNQKMMDKDLSQNSENEDLRLVSFLVCKKIDFDFKNCFSEIYETIDDKYRHNMILSLEDGLVTYSLDRNYLSKENQIHFDEVFGDIEAPLYPHPITKNDLLKSVIFKEITDPYMHMKMFLHSISSLIQHSERPIVELQNYYLK